MPRVNWVKSVPSGQPQRAPSANTSATRASASLPERMISMVGSPLLRYPSTTTMSWPGMLRLDVRALDLAFHGLDAGDLPGRGDHRLARAGGYGGGESFPG